MPAPTTSSKRPAWITATLLVVAVIAYLLKPTGGGQSPPLQSPPRASASALADGGIPKLFASHTSDAWVESEGRVMKLLPDDSSTDGGTNARHQRMLVRITPDLTVLIAHNFDVAARIPAREGDTIRFRGQYEWSDKGGTVHFTHAPTHPTRDPEKRGWIELAGKRYE